MLTDGREATRCSSVTNRWLTPVLALTAQLAANKQTASLGFHQPWLSVSVSEQQRLPPPSEGWRNPRRVKAVRKLQTSSPVSFPPLFLFFYDSFRHLCDPSNFSISLCQIISPIISDPRLCLNSHPVKPLRMTVRVKHQLFLCIS